MVFSFYPARGLNHSLYSIELGMSYNELCEWSVGEMEDVFSERYDNYLTYNCSTFLRGYCKNINIKIK